MKRYLLSLLFSACGLAGFSQSKDDVWVSFYNEDSTLIGYKDSHGVEKIEPKFSGYTSGGKFQHLIAAMEEKAGQWKSYYLTKAGRTVGHDSLHIFDNGPDCESEGFIRFRDGKTDKVGLFDRHGNIAVPAVYNELTRVQNGLLVGLRDAQKEYWEKEAHDGCNHYSWKGGKEVLLDTSGTVLAENFKYDNALNFFSIQKVKTPPTDTTRSSFVAKDGGYYSVVSFEKEFSQWILQELRAGLTPERFVQISYDTLTWEAPDGWAKSSREPFLATNFAVLKNGLSEMLQPGTDYFISGDGLNPFMYEGPAFEKYYNNCGEPKKEQYPTMSVIVSHKSKDDFSQNHYEFLRTDDGYKLISVTVRDAQLR